MKTLLNLLKINQRKYEREVFIIELQKWEGYITS